VDRFVSKTGGAFRGLVGRDFGMRIFILGAGDFGADFSVVSLGTSGARRSSGVELGLISGLVHRNGRRKDQLFDLDKLTITMFGIVWSGPNTPNTYVKLGNHFR
jgi:hypothetical protein